MNILSLILDVLSVGFLALYWKYSDSMLLTIMGIAIFLTFSTYLMWDIHKAQQGIIPNRISIFIQMLIIWLSAGVFCVNQNWALYLQIIVAALIIIKWFCIFKGNAILNTNSVNIYDGWLLGVYCAFAFAPLPGRMLKLWTILFALTGIFIVYRSKLKKADIVLTGELLLWLTILYISNILEINILMGALAVFYIAYALNMKNKYIIIRIIYTARTSLDILNIPLN